MVKVTIEQSDGTKIVDLNNLHKRNVVMSNIVIRSAHSLSLIEKRILMADVSKFKTREVELTAAEYATTYDVDVKNAYNHLKEAALNLFDRYLTVNFKDGKNTGTMRIRWVSAIGYVDGQGKIQINFSPEIMPQLIDLKGQFTTYQLKQAASLRSIHSWRLLELLEQMRQKQGDGYLMISIDDFHHAMETGDSYRANYSLLRRYVIEPAIKELNEKDGWAIDYLPLKKGRKVEALRFDFQKDRQLRLLQSNELNALVKPVSKQRKEFDENNWIEGYRHD